MMAPTKVEGPPKYLLPVMHIIASYLGFILFFHHLIIV